MIKFYTPTYGSTRDDAYARIVKRVTGSFDLLVFMRGKPFTGVIPSDVRIMLGDGVLGDFMSSPVSWEIFSERAARLIEHVSGADVQLFDAPLHRIMTGERIEGFRIVNATRAIRCLDLSKADVSYRGGTPDKIERVHRWVFDEAAIPKDVHVFRPQSTMRRFIL